jgi:hypothetical protein
MDMHSPRSIPEDQYGSNYSWPMHMKSSTGVLPDGLRDHIFFSWSEVFSQAQ